MVYGSTKRIVVIRDIPSNIIEEAILILKGEPGTAEGKSTKGVDAKKRKDDSDFLLKEAEMIINTYVKECKARGIYNGEKTRKPGFFKGGFPANVVINLALAGSIILLVFLLTRFL